MITGDPIAPAHATPEPGGGSTALPWWKANKPDLVLYTCDRKTPAWECFAGEGCSHVFVPLDLKNPATLEYQMESGVLPAAKLGYRQCKIRVLAELESALLGLFSAPHPHPNQLSTQPTCFCFLSAEVPRCYTTLGVTRRYNAIAFDNYAITNQWKACGSFSGPAGEWVQLYDGTAADKQYTASDDSLHSLRFWSTRGHWWGAPPFSSRQQTTSFMLTCAHYDVS